MKPPVKIALIISGGIAAYKIPELIRRGRERGMDFTCIMTEAASRFVAPLALAAVSGNRVLDDLFSLTDEVEMGHIRLSRESDLVVVAPATADIMARMATGQANDLATAVLLATNRPVLIAPAMNPAMWEHPATQRNVERLRQDGVAFVGPASGDMACGETGPGRMAEPGEVLDAILDQIRRCEGPSGTHPLAARHAIVTSGPTHEAIDPVRYIANHSSGRQGHAIARALADAGARVTLVSGPVTIADPKGVDCRHVVTAREMLEAVETALPADIAICAAAVADWRPQSEERNKLKKDGSAPPSIRMVENPDILARLAGHPTNRPELVIGFAAETERHEEHARAKLTRKACDWILMNDVGATSGVFGGSHNRVMLLRADGTGETWELMEKSRVAQRLVDAIAACLTDGDGL
ncbi:MAG: bifunctional phosphopantothenoylcysteine decarboxylase/phosphopantothenate--cysteine ligase CoaBC [Geminicoccaceae bacterium]